MLGNDAKVIFKRNKTVDVTGIDNHELNALPMVDATAKTITDKGPIILILWNYAYHGLNWTLHSTGQIEWFQNKVYDTSMKVGGRQVIKTVDGYFIPINVIQGLPYCWMKKNDVAKMRQAGTAPATGTTIYCPTSLWSTVIYKPCSVMDTTNTLLLANVHLVLWSDLMSDLLCYLSMLHLEFGVSEYSE